VVDVQKFGRFATEALVEEDAALSAVVVDFFLASPHFDARTMTCEYKTHTSSAARSSGVLLPFSDLATHDTMCVRFERWRGWSLLDATPAAPGFEEVIDLSFFNRTTTGQTIFTAGVAMPKHFNP